MIKKYKVIGKFHFPLGSVIELREEEGDPYVVDGRLEEVKAAPKKSVTKRKTASKRPSTKSSSKAAD